MADDGVMKLVGSLFGLAVAVINLCLSKARLCENKRLAEKYQNNVKMLQVRYLITNLLKLASIALMFGIASGLLNTFIVFYIFTPLLIILNIVFFEGSHLIRAIMTTVKGGYYIGLAVLSGVQFLTGNPHAAELAVGFTMALAIFEGAPCVWDGVIQLCCAEERG